MSNINTHLYLTRSLPALQTTGYCQLADKLIQCQFPQKPTGTGVGELGFSTFVLLIFSKRLNAGHQDVVIAQKLIQQEAAEAVTKALVLHGI